MRRALPLLLAALILAGLLFWFRQAATPPGAVPPAERPRANPAVKVEAPPPVPAAPAAPESLPAASPAPAAEEGNYRIHGRVAAGGAGVAGAKVQVRAWSGTEKDTKWTVRDALTRADGTFSVRMDRSEASMGFGVETAAEGYLEGWLLLKPGEYDEDRGVEVPIEPARAIVGRVVDEYARPIRGTGVELWYGSETTWPTNADAEGRFRTRARAPRGAFELVVAAPGYTIRRVPVPAAPSEDVTDVGELVFRRGGRLAGTAVDRQGRPMPGLALCLLHVAGGDDRAPKATTDEAGRFAFEDLGEGEVAVCVAPPATARDAAGATRNLRGVLKEVQVGRTDLELVVGWDTVAVLRFVDAATGEGIGVKEAEATAWVTGTEQPKSMNVGSSSSDPFTVLWVTVESGPRYDFLVRCAGFEDARLQGVDLPDVAKTVVDVPLRRSR